MLNFIATDLRLYKIFNIRRVSFLGHSVCLKVGPAHGNEPNCVVSTTLMYIVRGDCKSCCTIWLAARTTHRTGPTRALPISLYMARQKYPQGILLSFLKNANFPWVPCGKLSWLPVSFYAQRVCIEPTMPWQDVCPFIRLSHAGILSKRLNISSKFFFTVGYRPF